MNDHDRRDGSTLRDYLQVLTRHRWLIIAVAVLATVAAVLLSRAQDPRYESTAQVLLSRQNIATAITRTPDPAASQSDFARVVQTQAVVARAPAVTDRVVKTLRLPPAVLTGQQLLDDSTVEAAENVDVLDFTVQNGDKALARRLATEYARQFTIYRSELDTVALERAGNEVDQQLARLRSRGEQNSDLYNSLLQNQQQLRTLRTLQTSNASLLHPGTSASQVQPKPLRNGVIAFVLGLALGIGLAFLREALDTRVRSREEIERTLGLPLLAGIPEPPRQLRRDKRLVTLADPQSPAAEAFRMLRTGIDVANVQHQAQSIMVTSAVAEEGKSTTIANLAVTLARRGWRVVLVDLDLRRPTLHQFFDLGMRPGLTDVVMGEVELDRALKQVAVQGSPLDNAAGFGTDSDDETVMSLEVLTAGKLPRDAGDFVNLPALGRLLNELRDRSDLLLVDTPPALTVGDALSLSTKVDGVLLVSRLNELRRHMVRDLDRTLGQMPSAKLGYVLTGAEAEVGYGDFGRYYLPTERVPSSRR